MKLGDFLKKSYKIAVCGMSTALSVVLMFLGGVLYIFSYTTPLLLGVIMLMLNKTFGKSSAIVTYFAVSVLSLILVSDKESVLFYISFFGYYPIIKSKLDAMKYKALTVILKILLFNFALAVTEVISFYVFGIPFFENGIKSVWIVVSFALAMNVIFALFEYLLNKFIILYVNRLEPKLKKLLK